MTISHRSRIIGMLFLCATTMAGRCEGCNDGDIVEEPELHVAAAPRTGTVGEPLERTVVVYLSDRADDGRGLVDEIVTWTVTAGGGTVVGEERTDDDGYAEAEWTLGPVAGEQELTIQSFRQTTTARVTAQAGPAETLIASEAVLVFDALGDSATLSVSAVDRFGNDTGVAGALWASQSTDIATVDSAGTVTAIGNGSTSVIATLGAAADTVLVEVAAVATTLEVRPDSVAFDAIDDAVTLAAEARDANGNLLDADVAWTVVDSAVAAVSPDGTVRARADGTTTVTATSGALADATIVVVDQAVADVSIDAATTVLEVGETTTLAAAVLDANGHPVATPVAWSSADTAVASVDDAGVVSAVAVGSVFVRAIAEGVSDSVAIEVTPVDSFFVSPDSLQLAVGDTATLRALVVGPADSLFVIEASWSSRDTAVATVSGVGLVTAAGAGATWIVAEVPDEADSAYVAVGAGP